MDLSHVWVPAAHQVVVLTETQDGLRYTMPVQMGSASLDLVVDTGTHEMMAFNHSRCTELMEYQDEAYDVPLRLIQCFSVDSPTYSPGVDRVELILDIDSTSPNRTAFDPKATANVLAAVLKVAVSDLVINDETTNTISFAVTPSHHRLPNVTRVLTKAMEAGLLGPVMAINVASYQLAPSEVWSRSSDGETVVDKQVVRGTEQVSMTVRNLFFEARDSTTPVITEFLLSGHTSADPANTALLHTFLDCSGLIGLGYPPSDQGLSSFLSLMAPFSSEALTTPLPAVVFGLDLNLAPAESVLHLGGVHDGIRESIQWSPPDTLPSEAHTFSMFHLSMCGQSLLHGNSAVAAVVDTGASCLSLPAEIFDQVLGHLPALCHPWPTENATNAQSCSLAADIDPRRTRLPTLSFTMQKEGLPLHLPLSRIIRPWQRDKEFKQRLCMHRGLSVKFGAQISLGAMPLGAFYAAFNMATHQVGLANKLATSASDVMCVGQIACKGMQTQDARQSCEDPKCNQFYFYALHNESKTCVLSWTFHAVFASAFAIFVVSQLALQEVRLYLAQKVMITVENSPF